MILINLLPHREERRKRRKAAFFAGLAVAVAGGLLVAVAASPIGLRLQAWVAIIAAVLLFMVAYAVFSYVIERFIHSRIKVLYRTVHDLKRSRIDSTEGPVKGDILEEVNSEVAAWATERRTEIRELHLRLKTTTVYVTHDQIEAMTMADKIVVMQGGRIEQVGAPLDLYDRPVNSFVAGFIGSPAMNMLPGEVRRGAVVLADGTALPLPSRVDVADGREVTYGVRPEHLTVASTGIAGLVAVVEPTGSETHVVLRAGGQDVVAMFRDRVPFRPGDALTFAPEAAKAHLFDKATGVRLS